MNKFLGYIKSILGNSDSSNTSHVTTTESTQKHLHTNISGVKDQFTFLYNNFNDYRKDKNPPIDFTHATTLVEKYFNNKSNGSECIYRGMGLSIESIRKIYEKGMLIQDTEDSDDAGICFTVEDSFYSQRTISRASQSEQDQLSFIFQIPTSLLKEHQIPGGGGGDKFTIYGDIPADIIQQCAVFVVDYKNQTLVKISPIQ